MNFTQQAYKGKNDWWRYMLIIGLFVTPFFSKAISVYILKPILTYFDNDVDARFILTQCKYLILLVTFLFLFSFLHKRDLKSLVNNRKRFDYLRFWLSFSIWGVFLILIFSLAVILNPDIYIWNFKFSSFIKLLFFSILLLPFRVSFIVFFLNSYLIQMLTRVLKKPWFALVVMVFIYTSIRYARNQSTMNIVGNQMILYYIAVSLLIGLIIILDNGIEIILGMFYVSTLISKLFITYSTNKTQIDSIFIKTGGKDAMLFSYVIPFICCPLFFICFYKIYNWTNWREKLFDKVDKPEII